MSVAKIIEITSESPDSFQEAIAEGIRRAAGTVDNIKSAWVQDQQVVVDGDSITTYRVTLKVTFVLAD